MGGFVCDLERSGTGVVGNKNTEGKMDDIICVMAAEMQSKTSDIKIFFKVFECSNKDLTYPKNVIFLYGADYDSNNFKDFLPTALEAIIIKNNLNGHKIKVFLTKTEFSIIKKDDGPVVVYKIMKYAWDNDDKRVGDFIIVDDPFKIDKK